MQYRLDPVGGEGVAYLMRQARHRVHPVGRRGDDGKTAFAEFAGKVARQVRPRQIEQRAGLLQRFCLDTCEH